MERTQQQSVDALIQRIADLEQQLQQQTDNRDLLHCQALHRALVNASPWGIVTMTSDGKIESFNRAAEHIFGYPARDVIGAPVTRLMPQRMRPMHEAGRKRFLETRRPTITGHSVDLIGLRSDRVEIPIAITITAVETASDTLFIAVIQPRSR